LLHVSFSTPAECAVFQAIFEEVDALVTFKMGAPYPHLKAFRWKGRRQNVMDIEQLRPDLYSILFTVLKSAPGRKGQSSLCDSTLP